MSDDEKRLITIEDLTKIKYVEDPRISPDGQWIAYVQMNTNMMKRGYDRNVYLVATSGGKPIQLTFSGKDTTPRWSPDGNTLAFVSARNEKPQVYLLPVGRPGEARQLTKHEMGAFGPEWSPDGEWMAYFSRLNKDEMAREDNEEQADAPKDELDAKQRRERQAEDEKQRFDPRPMERIPYRQGVSYMDDRKTQIYITRTDEGLEGDDAKPRRVTQLDTYYGALQWAPNGKTIYSTRPSDLDADEYFRYFNATRIDVETLEETLLADPEHGCYAIQISPDGEWLAMIRRIFGKVDTLLRLSIMKSDGSEVHDLNLELDRPIYSFQWQPEGHLMVGVATEGRIEVHQVNPQTKTFTPIMTERQSLFGFDSHESGAIAYVSRTSERLDELFYRNSDGETQQMSDANSWVSEIDVQATHELRFKNPDGYEVQGWYILPPNYEAGKSYPLALNIHGGPHVMWAPAQRSMWHEWQTHAAAGYVVFYCNPRGSDGYGENHLYELHSAWGDVAMEDIMAGVDTLIEQGIVDGDKMALTGGSYGGYMTSWIIGHTERFKSAVTQRGVYNLTSFYGTTDIPILISSEFDTEPWDDFDKLWHHSPLAYASKVTTPTLIIHAENDFRVPIEQAEQLFAWIRRATDTPVKMLRYPREGHELSRSGEPQHRISRLTEMLEWFKQYCPPS